MKAKKRRRGGLDRADLNMWWTLRILREENNGDLGLGLPKNVTKFQREAEKADFFPFGNRVIAATGCVRFRVEWQRRRSKV